MTVVVGPKRVQQGAENAGTASRPHGAAEPIATSPKQQRGAGFAAADLGVAPSACKERVTEHELVQQWVRVALADSPTGRFENATVSRHASGALEVDAMGFDNFDQALRAVDAFATANRAKTPDAMQLAMQLLKTHDVRVNKLVGRLVAAGEGKLAEKELVAWAQAEKRRYYGLMAPPLRAAVDRQTALDTLERYRDGVRREVAAFEGLRRDGVLGAEPPQLVVGGREGLEEELIAWTPLGFTHLTKALQDLGFLKMVLAEPELRATIGDACAQRLSVDFDREQQRIAFTFSGYVSELLIAMTQELPVTGPLVPATQAATAELRELVAELELGDAGYAALWGAWAEMTDAQVREMVAGVPPSTAKH